MNQKKKMDWVIFMQLYALLIFFLKKNELIFIHNFGAGETKMLTDA